MKGTLYVVFNTWFNNEIMELLMEVCIPPFLWNIQAYANTDNINKPWKPKVTFEVSQCTNPAFLTDIPLYFPMCECCVVKSDHLWL